MVCQEAQLLRAVQVCLVPLASLERWVSLVLMAGLERRVMLDFLALAALENKERKEIVACLVSQE